MPDSQKIVSRVWNIWKTLFPLLKKVSGFVEKNVWFLRSKFCFLRQCFSEVDKQGINRKQNVSSTMLPMVLPGLTQALACQLSSTLVLGYYILHELTLQVQAARSKAQANIGLSPPNKLLHSNKIAVTTNLKTKGLCSKRRILFYVFG